MTGFGSTGEPIAEIRGGNYCISQHAAAIGLPFHDELTEAEIDRVVACLR